MLRLVTSAVAAVSAEHPAVRIEAAEAEVEEALLALARGALDLVIGDEYAGVPIPVPAWIPRERLLDEQVRLVMPAGHPLARRPGRRFRSPRCATPCGRPASRERATARCSCARAGRLAPDLRHRSNDLLVLLTFVRDAGAMALLSDLVGAEHPSVAARGIAEGAVRRRVWASRATGRAGGPRSPLCSRRCDATQPARTAR